MSGIQGQAACAEPGMNPAWWDAHRKDTEAARRAIAVCHQCPIEGACLEDALRNQHNPANRPSGIRGGLTAPERAVYHLRKPRRPKPTTSPDHHQKEPATVDDKPTTTDPVQVPVLSVASRPKPEQAKPNSAEALIAWGMQHPSARMNRLAGQARTALADLQQSQRKEAAVSTAEEHVQKLKRQLAEAEKALRVAKGTNGASSPAAKATPVADRPARDELDTIRTWARENGHEVADRGRIPRNVVDAYRAAHPAPLAQAS
ncbi:histone-like nucleoid-structuring protein Lsr2 [Peterkaempfera sp. SMS 1(5)a]|uniref:Lsr2 family DNA-binding protein n=1 Tax=Peterkaempfera podocarpi TaxID=3232308 RepID=UPI0036728C41